MLSRHLHVRGLRLFAGLALLGAAAAQTPPAAEITSEPLPPRRAVTGPRFTTLAPELTGITAANRADDPAMWGERYEEYAYGSLGTGLAIGDYDHDGRPDVFVVSKVGPSHLYRNLGAWHFADVTAAAGINDGGPGWKHGIAFVDLNNDGWLDLYLCRNGAPNQLYLNQHDGTFREAAAAAGLAVDDASVMAAFADYDADGRLDVYVQTNLRDHVAAPRGQRDRLFRNRGDGTFEDVTVAAGIFGETQGHSATWWDYNHDGRPDLYVANDFVTPDQLYHNRGNGTFLNVLDFAVDHFPHFAMGADLGDVDNDGRLDLLVVDMRPTSRDRHVHGMLNMQATMARDVPPNAAAQYLRNALYLDTGAGYLQEAAFLAGVAATDWSWSARFEDLDEDGRVDLHVTNGMVRDFLDGDLIARISNLPIAQRRAVVRDSAPLRERNLAFRNLGHVRFAPVAREWGLDHEGISFGAAFGDLDGDGDLDLVFANLDAPPTVCRNESADTHRLLVTLEGSRSNRGAVGALVRVETSAGVQVRQLSVARGYASSSEPLLHFGLGAETKVDRLVVTWPSGGEQVFTNLPADRHYRIRESDVSPTTPGVARPEPQFTECAAEFGLAITPHEMPVDEFASQPLLPRRMQPVGPGLAIDDLDGDGADDLVVGGLAGWPAQVWLRPGRTFSLSEGSIPSRAAAVADATPLIFDASGDGTADLLLAAAGVNRPAGDPAYLPRLLLGGGFGQLRNAPSGSVPATANNSSGPVAAADWNRDGKVDVLVGGRAVPGAYGATPKSALWLNRGGTFEEVTEQVAPGLANAGMLNTAVWCDVDDDGWPDLIVAGEWTGVRCWRNVAGQRFEEITEALGFSSAGRGWWNSIVAADFNGDGKMDFALGNVGLNTRYHASSTEPAVLLRGVFEPGRAPQLIEADTRDGRLLPVRARLPFVSAIPSAGRRAPTHTAYAVADIATLVGAENLAKAERFDATELRSGVLLSGAKGYAFVALPNEAQISPTFGMAAADFDGDGAADLFVVHNSQAPTPEIGRFGGGVGLWLRGDGRGSFQAVNPAESGVVIPGEARAVAVTDLDRDGWPDVVVTRRDAKLLAYRNRGNARHRSFGIRIRGAGSIGARVSITTVSGRRAVAQHAVGEGWLSQSSPTLFFGYDPADPPSELRVRWPDGSESRGAWRQATTILLDSPARR